MRGRRVAAVWTLVAVAAVLTGCDRRTETDPGGAEGALKNGSSPDASGNGSQQTPRGREGESSEVSEERYRRQREQMVEQLASSASDVPITDPKVLEALRKVPRHEFVPVEFRSQSYQNTPLPIQESQTISQPYIVALMTQLLALDGTEKVLEVGTGSGYQAAILGELASEVYTVEIRGTLLESARKTLEALKADGILHYRKLEALHGDGSLGYKPAAPYDAIIVTAAPKKVPVELLNQLKVGGRLVVPVGGDYIQELQLIRKKEDGSYVEQPIVPVRFVPLVKGGAGDVDS
jgi:protein-L-isoaspartate(D-aspartate) O-methyltransferase